MNTMINPDEYQLLHDYQQTSIDDEYWFDLYMRFLTFGGHVEETTSAFEQGLEQATRLKKQLQHQWQLLNHVFDNLPFAILLFNERGQVVHHNQKAQPLATEQAFLDAIYAQLLKTNASNDENNQASGMSQDFGEYKRDTSFQKKAEAPAQTTTDAADKKEEDEAFIESKDENEDKAETEAFNDVVNIQAIDTEDMNDIDDMAESGGHDVPFTPYNEQRTFRWQAGTVSYYIGIMPYRSHRQVSHIVYGFSDALSVNDEVLSRLYDISEAECRVIHALMLHGNSKIAAQHMDIKFETLRTHLKKIMGKTNTHSQAELMVKLLSGPHWLGEIQQMQIDQNLGFLDDLTSRPLVSLGCEKGSIIVVFPSFFGILWDFIEENASAWHLWAQEEECHLIIVNNHAMFEKKQWSNLQLNEVCQQMAMKLNPYLETYQKQAKKGVSLLGIHSGAAYALNLGKHLNYPVNTIKLVSAILPSPFMKAEDIRHIDYRNVHKTAKIPKQIWFTIASHIIELACRNKEKYFIKRLERQQYETDRAKVRRWASHPYLPEYFTDYGQRACHKIAFDMRLVDSAWEVADNRCQIHCFVGEHDIYTSVEATHRFAKKYKKTQVHEIEDGYYTMPINFWQQVLLFKES